MSTPSKDLMEQGWKAITAQGRIRYQQEHLLRKSLDDILQDRSIPPRDKILLQMRADEESTRRKNMYTHSAYVPRNIPYPPTSSICSSVTRSWFPSCLNTTLALYLFDKRQNFPCIRAIDIESWLWRQWFKPYESDITLHNFYSIFAVEYDADLIHTDLESHPDELVAFHCNSYEQAQRARDTVFREEANDGSMPAIHGPLRSWPWRLEDFYSPIRPTPYSLRAARVIKPLFRAVFIALFYPQENVHLHRTPEQLRRVKVQLILTGMTEGLSAPISLKELEGEALDDSYYPGATAITTSLHAAVHFIIRLEEREIAAAGGIQQPDVAKLRGWDWHRKKAKELGWVEERDGKLDDLTPRSCEWVDQTIFKKWVGEGAIDTMKYALGWGTKLDPFRDDEENLWWDRKYLPEKPPRWVKPKDSQPN